MMKITACLFLALAFLLAACHKDDVDVNDLNFNPFDPGYVGPAIVELDHSYTDTYTTPGGGTIFRFNVVVQVRTDRLDHDTEYSLWSRPFGSSTWYRIAHSTQVDGDEFTIRYDNYSSGAEYCADYAIGTLNAYGASAAVCATAP